MKNLYLLNKILATTKENHLVFMAPKPGENPAPLPEGSTAVDAPAPGTETADPGPKPADAAPKAPEAPTKDKLAERAGKLKGKVADILDAKNKDKYTEDLKKGAQEIQDKIAAIETEVGKLDATKDIKKELESFDNNLKVFEAKGDKDLDAKYSSDVLAADAAVKTAQDALTKTKAEVTAEKVAKNLEAKVTLTDDQKKELKGQIDAMIGKIEKDLDDKLKDPKSSATDKKTAAEAAAAKLSEITVDKVAQYTGEAIEAAEKQKTLITRAYEVMNTTADGNKEKLNFTEAELTKVMGTYERGIYENPKEEATAAAVMKALKDNKEALKAKNIHIGFLGGTDGTNYKDKLAEDKAFNDKKSEAFKDLLNFNTNGRVSPALTADQIASIEAYNTAVAAGMPAVKTFFDDAATKSKFFTGGGIFDLALAYQRAQDRNMQIFGKDAKLNSKLDYLNLELGTTNDTPAERKSGITFIETTPEEVEFEGKYTDKPFRDEIKKGSPNATDQEIELKTFEVFNEEKHGTNLEAARKDPKFKAEIIKRLNTPVEAPEAATKKTFEEAKTAKIIEQHAGDTVNWYPLPGFVWVDSPVGKKTAEEQNWAVKPIETAPVAPAYTMEFKDNKLTVKFKDEEKPREYVVGQLPEGMKAEVQDGEYLIFTSGEDKAFITFTDSKEIMQSFMDASMSLRRSHAINIDTKATPPTITVEKRKEVADHGYIYNEETKELTVKNKDTGKVETYKINAPADVKIQALENDDGDFFLNVTAGDKNAWIEFDPSGKLVTDSSDENKTKGLDLAKTHDITPDGTNINIKPKATPEVADKKTFEEAKAAKDIVEDPTTKLWKPKEDFNWVEKLKAGETSRTNWAVKPIETAPVATPEYGYQFVFDESDTKNEKPQLEVKHGNEKKVFPIENPDGATLSIIENASSKDDKYVEVGLNSKKAYFEFDGKDGSFDVGPRKGFEGQDKDLRTTHDIKFDGAKISITPKAAPAVNPPSDPTPAAPAEASENADNMLTQYEVSVANASADEAKNIAALKALIATGVTVVDFSGTDCGPCRAFKPQFDAIAKSSLAKEGEKIKFANLNYEEMDSMSAAVATEFKIDGFPTILIFKNGNLVKKVENRANLEGEIMAAV